MAWVDAGDTAVRPGAQVSIALAGGETRGVAVVTPELLTWPPGSVSGVLLATVPVREAPGGVPIPLAELPPLGSRVTVEGSIGTVTALEPVPGNVTVTLDGSATVVLPARDVEVTDDG